MANRIVSDEIWGKQHIIIIDHDGPASYTNSGVFSTSGETVNASDLGVGGFDFVDEITLSSDGLNTVEIAFPSISTSGNFGDAQTKFTVHWFVAASGAEVANAVNLSTKAVRLRLSCR